MLCHTTAMALMANFADGSRPPAIGSTDSEIVPVRCHWEEAADSSNCSVVLEAVEDAWAVQVDHLGFHAPMPDDDGVLDIYLTDNGTYGGAYTLGPYEDEDTGDGRMGCHAYIAVDSALPRGLLPIYVAHEFNHVLQFATDFTEPYLPMWEATASAAELWTYPDDELDRGPIRDFQAEPWLGILGDGYMVPDNNWSLYEYGAVVWILHLDYHWGDGLGSAGPALWQAAEQDGWTNEPDMIDAYDSLTGDWQDALMELHIERARLGTDDPPEWGSNWTQSGFAVAVVDEVESGDLPVSLTPDQGPIQTGVVYVAITNATPGEPFTLSIDGATTVNWGLLVVDGPDSTWEIGRELTWTANTGTLIVGAVNLGDDNWDADRSIRQAEPLLNIWGIDGPGSDGGDDGGGDGTDGGDDGSSGDGSNGNPDGGGKGGCSSTGGAPVGWAAAPLLLLGLLRRRRQV